MNKPENPPAFPERDFLDSGTQDSDVPGMTLLDYFAAKAMQGMNIKTDPNLLMIPLKEREIYIASKAYELAQAMLAEREKRMNPDTVRISGDARTLSVTHSKP